jgi:hypothetical protein
MSYVCDYCSKGFASKKTRKEHQSGKGGRIVGCTAANPKPASKVGFVCDYCSKGFASKKGRKEHHERGCTATTPLKGR